MTFMWYWPREHMRSYLQRQLMLIKEIYTIYLELGWTVPTWNLKTLYTMEYALSIMVLVLLSLHFNHGWNRMAYFSTLFGMVWWQWYNIMVNEMPMKYAWGSEQDRAVFKFTENGLTTKLVHNSLGVLCKTFVNECGHMFLCAADNGFPWCSHV